MASAEHDDENFDILDVKCPIKCSTDFRVSFDLYTPRAHFIILSKPKREDIARVNFCELGDVEKEQVVQLALDTTKVLALNEATLAVHRGNWNTSKYLCQSHICTGIDPYLEIFDEFMQKEPMRHFWPSSKFVTNMWKASRDPNDYVKNVKGYPYSSYKKEELYDANQQKTRGVGPGLTSYEGKVIVYHTQCCCIGVAGAVTKDARNFKDLVVFLDKFSRDGLGAQSGKEGCHICVDLTGKGFPSFSTEEPVLGYVHVTGGIFYKNCPAEQRDQWLLNFEKEDDGKVHT